MITTLLDPSEENLFQLALAVQARDEMRRIRSLIEEALPDPEPEDGYAKALSASNRALNRWSNAIKHEVLADQIIETAKATGHLEAWHYTFRDDLYMRERLASLLTQA